VDFDNRGKVVAYYSYTVPDNSESDPARTVPMVPPSVYNQQNMSHITDYEEPLDQQSFDLLCRKIKGASFKTDKMDLIEVACLRCNFSSRQTADFLKFFDFDDDRLKALRLLAPCTVDQYDINQIFKVFDFDSNREKASDIMR
jgi:hypothetical protein